MARLAAQSEELGFGYAAWREERCPCAPQHDLRSWKYREEVQKHMQGNSRTTRSHKAHQTCRFSACFLINFFHKPITNIMKVITNVMIGIENFPSGGGGRGGGGYGTSPKLISPRPFLRCLPAQSTPIVLCRLLDAHQWCLATAGPCVSASQCCSRRILGDLPVCANVNELSLLRRSIQRHLRLSWSSHEAIHARLPADSSYTNYSIDIKS